MKIFLTYASNPQTTAFYLEKALREICDVITYGPAISKETLKKWNLMAIADRVQEHQIPLTDGDMINALNGLPKGWKPDALLFIDTGVFFPLTNISAVNCTKACYMIDSHINFERHLDFVKSFDIVFTAHKPAVEMFNGEGFNHVFWIPPACDPEIHGRKTGEKLYDIGFVGSLNANFNPERVHLLNELKQRFHVHYERCFLERMAEVFSRSKIVFNKSIMNGLNMRVFEVLAAGSLLLTDESKESGLTELFEEKRDLVIYRNEEELFELAYHYLRHGEEREKIAEEGRKKVLKEHTYHHRARDIIETLSAFKK
ncbi:MAG: glycosyltransferase [Candidatus Scalindua sp.]|nr:glycosyltransferase [Candidatus Scalindua sp.]